jgi:acyl-CoA thioesterase FadM
VGTKISGFQKRRSEHTQMAKVILKEENSYDFRYRLKAQIHHVNYSGHVGHDAIVQMIWEARVNLLKDLGLTELDLGDGKTGIIMTDLEINFLREILPFDELLIESKIDDVSENGFRIYHRITKDGKTCVLAETGFLSFNYSTHRVCTLPKQFLKILKEKGKREGESV